MIGLEWILLFLNDMGAMRQIRFVAFRQTGFSFNNIDENAGTKLQRNSLNHTNHKESPNCSQLNRAFNHEMGLNNENKLE